MIHRIFSDLETFKELTFTAGLNVLLAEKSPDSTTRHTRNRAGKSSMVEVVHFLLGSSARTDSLFRTAALKDYTFGMDFDLAGSGTSVERTGAKPSNVFVEGDFAAWPVTPRARGGRPALKNSDWKTVLGHLMFGLTVTEEQEGKWSPSVRSLFSYFARRERDGGFHTPVKQNKDQQLADQQVNISYLLGLDWTIPQELQRVRERERNLGELRKSLKEGTFGQVIDRASALKTQLVLAQDRVARLRQRVSSFKVVDEYHELEREASELTAKLAALSDENTLDRRYVAELEKASSEEVAPSPPDLQKLYREAGVVLPELVQRRFEDVKVFHESVIRNRASYLRGELLAAQHRMAERAIEQRRLDDRRAEIMAILSSSGALEHFTALQGEVVRAEGDVELLRQRYDTAEALESGTLKLKMERARLQERLREDYAERVGVVDDAIITFQRISSALYEDEAAGSLTITPTENGPDFSIEIQGAKSRGVSNMQVFCFDMMLTLLSIKSGRSPGFLIHDSHLFDGVDERQVGKALALGAQLAEEYGFQYIVTMNTDAVPTEVPDGFRLEDYALPVRLSDATENGGLFGFRFD
ncbi:MAG: hypothetical protein AMXMBFR64_39560 [Myxococcales bacterium]